MPSEFHLSNPGNSSHEIKVTCPTHLRREGVLPLPDRVAGLHDVVVVGEGGVDEGEVPVQRLDHLRRRAVRHEVVRVRRVPEEEEKNESPMSHELQIVELGSGFEVL